MKWFLYDWIFILYGTFGFVFFLLYFTKYFFLYYIFSIILLTVRSLFVCLFPIENRLDFFYCMDKFSELYQLIEPWNIIYKKISLTNRQQFTLTKWVIAWFYLIIYLFVVAIFALFSLFRSSLTPLWIFQSFSSEIKLKKWKWTKKK